MRIIVCGLSLYIRFCTFLSKYEGLVVCYNANLSETSSPTCRRQVRDLGQKPGCCPVSERLAKQKISHWGFPVNSNEAEIFFA